MGSFLTKQEDGNQQHREGTALRTTEIDEWKRKRDALLERHRTHKIVTERDEFGDVISLHWDDKPDENFLDGWNFDYTFKQTEEEKAKWRKEYEAYDPDNPKPKPPPIPTDVTSFSQLHPYYK